MNSSGLQRTSLFLIVFGFRNTSLGGVVELYEVWAISGYAYGLFAGFHTMDSVLDDM